MSIFTKVRDMYKNATPKQFITAGVFSLALAGAIAGGFASKTMSSAAILRDTNQANSIDNSYANGGIGAADANELIADIPTVSDLAGIYTNFGMEPGEYQRFIQTAKPGMALKNGDVVVDGKVVMTDAFSIGRTKFWYSWQHNISGVGSYWASMNSDVMAQDLPVMVMFDDNGTAEFVVMNACGNPVFGERKVSGFECKALNKTPVAGQDNTYEFTTSYAQSGYAQAVKFEYFVDGKSVAVKSSGSDKVKLTFTKDATVSVKVTFNLPGGKSKTITAVECEKKITVVKKEFMHVCDTLIATTADKKTFRFTMKTSQSAGVTVKSADFDQDGNVTSGVTSKDNSGNIYREYTFTDTVEHTVKIKQITFVVDGQNKVVVTPAGKCVAKVTREKTPECKPNIPVGDDRCKNYCKPGIEVGSKECEELPHTGPAGTAGLFVGVSAAAGAAHRLIQNRRNRRG